MTTFDRARDFVRRQARVLDQRLWLTLFEGGPPAGVVDALRAYRNDDGGFGHGLEPDKRCPHSQPLDVEVAFQTMDRAGEVDEALVRGACDFLETVTGDAGAVPLLLPSIADYPRADHLQEDFAFEPDLNPTSSLAGLLHKWGIDHPWRERATGFCWAELEREIPDEAHTLDDVVVFLDHAPDRERAAPLAKRVADAIPAARWYLADPDSTEYGVDPFHYAPTPASPWRVVFDDDHIDRHLDRLERLQQPDGGWAIAWNPPSEASTLEYRGVQTIAAVSALVAYGRITSG